MKEKMLYYKNVQSETDLKAHLGETNVGDTALTLSIEEKAIKNVG